MTSSSHLICAMSLGNKATKSIKQVNGKDRFFIFLNNTSLDESVKYTI